MNPEIAAYYGMINDLRGSVANLLGDQPSTALNWRPIAGNEGEATNSLATLVAHVAGSEHYWIGEVVGKGPPTRDRDAGGAASAGGQARSARSM